MSVMPVLRDDRLRLLVIVSPDAHAEECQVPIVITSPGAGRRSTSLSMPSATALYGLIWHAPRAAGRLRGVRSEAVAWIRRPVRERLRRPRLIGELAGSIPERRDTVRVTEVAGCALASAFPPG